MDFIISFFRDVLDGPLYIAVVVINVILICAGIGYFAERSQNKKAERQKNKDSYVDISGLETQNSSYNKQSSIVSNNNVVNPFSMPSNVVSGKTQSSFSSQITQGNVSSLTQGNVPIPSNIGVVNTPVQNIVVQDNIEQFTNSNENKQ